MGRKEEPRVIWPGRKPALISQRGSHSLGDLIGGPLCSYTPIFLMLSSLLPYPLASLVVIESSCVPVAPCAHLDLAFVCRASEQSILPSIASIVVV